MRDLIKDKKQLIILITSFILISYFGFSLHLLEVKSVTWDDLSMAMTGYDLSSYIFMAYDQSRVSFFMNSLLMGVPYIFDNHIYFKIVQILTNIASVVSIGVLLGILFKNKYLWYVYSILALTLWQNSDGHNLLVSYSFYAASAIFTLSISSIFFVYFLRSRKNIYLIISLVAWIITYKGTEFYPMYFPMFFFIAYFESSKDFFKEKVKDSFLKIKWHVLTTFILFILYVGFRVLVGAEYGGRSLGFDLNGFFSSLVTYSIGLAPGMQFYFNFKDSSFYELISLIDSFIILVSILVVYLLIIFKEKIQQIELPGKNFLLVILYLTLAPNFLISLTFKYQYYVSFHEVNNYLYSAFSFFAILLIMIIALVRLKKNSYYYILVFVISIFVVITQVNNKVIGAKQSQYSEKYSLLDALLDSSYVSDKKEGFTILAPSLWDELIVAPDYWIEDAWTRYSKRKLKGNIKINRYADNYDANIKYFISNKRSSSFLTYSEGKKLKAIFISSKKCSKKNACYLLSTKNSLNGSLMHNNFINTNTIYKVQTLSDTPHEIKQGINTYPITGDISSKQAPILLDYNPMLNKQKVISFNEGFYSLEGSGDNQWIWASGDGIINIRSPINTLAKLKISLRAASPRGISFKINDNNFKNFFMDTSRQDVIFSVNLTQGDNQLRIKSDAKSVKLSEEDKRVFSYAIFDISIMDSDN